VRPRTPAAAWGWWCRGVVFPAGLAAAEGGQDAGDVAGGFARDGGYHVGGDADGSAVGEVEGVPDVGDEFADLAGYRGLQGCGNGDVFGGEASHGCPESAEFLQCGLAVKAVALVAGELARVPVGGLFEQLVDVGAAGEAAGGAGEQLADVVDRLAGIGHSRSPPLL
jgi:hypothetical protein